MELKYIVYLTINLCNGKFYIGVHRTNPKVFDGYIGCGVYRLSNANKSFAFHKAVRKYGYEKFQRTIIREFPDTPEGRQLAYSLEAELITPTLLKSRTCYNTSVGGRGGINPTIIKPVYQFTLDGKLLNTFFSIGEAAKNVNPANSECAKQAIKNNCAGRTKSAFGFVWSRTQVATNKEGLKQRAVAQYTLSGKFLRYFDSIEEASAAMQCGTIWQAIHKHYQAAGYQWKYYTGDPSDIPPLINNGAKNPKVPIIMKTLKGEFIGEFESAQVCAKTRADLNLKTSQINRVLNRTMKSHRGFVFTFKKDEDIV